MNLSVGIGIIAGMLNAAYWDIYRHGLIVAGENVPAGFPSWARTFNTSFACVIAIICFFINLYVKEKGIKFKKELLFSFSYQSYIVQLVKTYAVILFTILLVVMLHRALFYKESFNFNEIVVFLFGITTFSMALSGLSFRASSSLAHINDKLRNEYLKCGFDLFKSAILFLLADVCWVIFYFAQAGAGVVTDKFDWLGAYGTMYLSYFAISCLLVFGIKRLYNSIQELIVLTWS